MSEVRTFTCALCKNDFESCWDEAEVEREYTDTFGAHMGEARSVLCDDCDELFKRWYKKVRKPGVLS
jgi:hypothetical protein